MTRSFSSLSLLATSTCLLFLAERYSLSSTPRRQFVPVIRHSSGKALNWAGYVAATDLSFPLKHSVTDVRGSWRVPARVFSGGLGTPAAISGGIGCKASENVGENGP